MPPSLKYEGRAIHEIKGSLYPDEIRFIRDAIPKRKNEFRAGRILARKAWRQLGIKASPLLVNRERYPSWPSEIVGSISHTDDYCGVFIGKSDEFHSIGFDVEIVQRVKPPLWSTFCTNKELSDIYSLPVHSQQLHAAAIFSAKESFFKCTYPLQHTFFSFLEIEIEGFPESGHFHVSLPHLPRRLTESMPQHGLFWEDDKYIFSLVYLES